MNRASQDWSLVIHGGAGNIEPDIISAAQQQAYRNALRIVAREGERILEDGGRALDAVESCVRRLEDDPLFNSGRGSAFTADGRNELDSAIMDGRTRNAGAVAGATRTKNPISLARAILDHSPHVMLAGSQAEDFGRTQGIEQVEPDYFFSERRWRSLERCLAAEGLALPSRPVGAPRGGDLSADLTHDEGKHGTVGVVACDVRGDLAAGTSTGGVTGKRWGRIGDSPIIGAGTYAANASCAVSATGTGEYFIRLGVARHIADLVEIGGLTLQQAVDRVIRTELTQLGGDGGVIAVAADGSMAWSFNTPGMYRARVGVRQSLQVCLFNDDP